MPDWLKSNLPVIVMFIIGSYVGLQTLEIKFNYQEQKAQERYRLLLGIQATTQSQNQKLTELTTEFSNLEGRLSRLEAVFPHSISTLEAEVNSLEKDNITIKKDIQIINMQIGNKAGNS